MGQRAVGGYSTLQRPLLGSDAPSPGRAYLREARMAYLRVANERVTTPEEKQRKSTTAILSHEKRYLIKLKT